MFGDVRVFELGAGVFDPFNPAVERVTEVDEGFFVFGLLRSGEIIDFPGVCGDVVEFFGGAR